MTHGNEAQIKITTANMKTSMAALMSAADARLLQQDTQPTKYDHDALPVVLNRNMEIIERECRKGLGSCYLYIPETIPDIPQYNLKNVKQLVINQLKSLGYTIRNDCCISWELEQQKQVETSQKQYRFLDTFLL